MSRILIVKSLANNFWWNDFWFHRFPQLTPHMRKCCPQRRKLMRLVIFECCLSGYFLTINCCLVAYLLSLHTGNTVNIKGRNLKVFYVCKAMDVAACWGTRDVESDLRFSDSNLLRFRAWSENQKGMDECHHCCYLQHVWWEGSGAACQKSLTWAKLFQEIRSLFLLVLFHPLPTCIGNRGLCG